MKHVCFLTLWVFSVFPCSSALISYQDYTLDDSTQIVTGGGLEWLQWSVTSTLSINAALALYSAQGWTLATNTQMATLLTDFEFEPMLVWTDVESATQQTAEPYDAIDDVTTDPYVQMATLFGKTYLYDLYEEEDGYQHTNFTGAFYGSDDNTDGLYKFVSIRDDYFDAAESFEGGKLAYIQVDNAPATLSSELFGVALVRPASEVPVSGSLLLIALAGVWIASQRFLLSLRPKHRCFAA